MGGTFDPIHHGHLVAASEVANRFDLDEVVFVPTGKPQGKHEDLSPAEQRYLVFMDATASRQRFHVSPVEIDRARVPYPVHTLKDLRAPRPGTQLFFLPGPAARAQIVTWKNADELWPLAHSVAVRRPRH